MTDVVERLRELARFGVSVPDTAVEDADEIERLAAHCRHLMAAPGTASWITDAKRREILADINAVPLCHREN